MVELCDYYLSHLDDAKRIAREGRKRILKEHTYLLRAKRVIKVLENLPNNSILTYRDEGQRDAE